MTRPNAATKKKLATYMFVIVMSRHSMRDNDNVVRVIPNAPIASAVCLYQIKASLRSVGVLTPAPGDLGFSRLAHVVYESDFLGQSLASELTACPLAFGLCWTSRLKRYQGKTFDVESQIGPSSGVVRGGSPPT